VRSDIQLLSYYINRFREERNIKKPISVRAVESIVEEKSDKPKVEEISE